ncbi:uncharacterized protein LOC132699321 [Cylas formicarius]|uniref:uncharacterized protein LOC132699321 n=1 Tax=Cylas formicarius TaxID=197179 RepID=UPI002958B7E3|nr:uncharacterized protein LOC132699321 [Cylas formicarius]
MTNKVENLDELIIRYLDLGEKIVSHEAAPLTKPGENFGSEILSVDFTVENPTDGSRRILSTVIKLVPDGEYARQMFNTPVTFRNEVGFYDIVVKKLHAYLLEKGVEDGANFAVKSYGSRLSLDPDSRNVDDDAVLVLENAKKLGYVTVNKLAGFDFDGAKLILATLAKFHAATLAFKLDEPKSFDDAVRPYLWDFQEDPRYEVAVARQLTKFLTEQNYPDGVVRRAADLMRKRSDPSSPEPWSAVIHYDCWVNNFLVKYAADGRPEHAVLVDFQLIGYKSPARDVVFFVFTSVASDVLTRNVVDSLFAHYHECLVDRLELLGIDTSKFSFEDFREELKRAALDSEFYHIALMLPPILEKDFVDLSYIEERGGADDARCLWNDAHKRRLRFVVDEFRSRGWFDEN